MEEFVEIAKTGIRFEFKHIGEDQLSLTYIGSGGHCAKLLPLYMTTQGQVIGHAGPPGSLFTFLHSDNTGYWGRICQHCKKYFRVDEITILMHCPYCGSQGVEWLFMTNNQRSYIRAFCKAYELAVCGEQDVVIDVDKIIGELPDNKTSPWGYAEEKQQTFSKCDRCGVTTDIMGDYCQCGNCGKPNAGGVVKTKLELLQQRVISTKAKVSDSLERQIVWIDILNAAVAEIDGFCRFVTSKIVTMPMHPRRRKRIGELKFQTPIRAFTDLNEWFDFDIFHGLGDEEKNLVNKMCNIRHLYSHNNGVVDQEYLSNTNDVSVRLGQKIRISSKNLSSFLGFASTLCTNYFTDYYAILEPYIENSGKMVGTHQGNSHGPVALQ